MENNKEMYIKSLTDMGFASNMVTRSLEATNYAGVEPAMEWILAHQDEDGFEETVSKSEEPKVEEAPKILTEEEKKEKLARLEELRIKKRAERLAKEAEEAKEKEKRRIESGKDMGEIRQALAEQEIRKLAEQRRREKEEEKKAKARVLAQIEADKAARRAEKEAAKSGVSNNTSATTASPAVTATPTAKKDYTETRIQIRQTNGQPIVHSFGVKEPLAAVRLYVDMNRSDGATGQVRFMTNFPKKVFSDEDYENTLENLGLVPSAVLMITK